MSEPADCTAVKTKRTMKPRARPITASMSIAPTMSKALPDSSAPGSICEAACTRGADTSAMPRARAALTGPGNELRLNGGDTTRNAARRMPDSMVDSNIPSSNESSTSRHQQRWQLLKQLVGEGHNLLHHPVARDKQRNTHAKRLGNKGQRDLLNLGH